MITTICNIAAALLYVGLGIACATRAIRTQRELAVLRREKAARRARLQERADGSDEGAKGLLFLLDDDEKPALLNMDGPMPTWLAGKKISQLTAFDAAYYAGYALREKSLHQLKSLVTASLGGLVLAKYLFASLSDTGRVMSASQDNVLLGLLQSGWHMVGAQLPVLIGVFLLGWSWRQKERADEDDFNAKMLEDQARTAYARDEKYGHHRLSPDTA